MDGRARRDGRSTPPRSAGLTVSPNLGIYNVTKAALIHLTKQLALELAPQVRVNAVAPGIVRTRLSEALWKDHESEVADLMPLGRIGVPADVGSAVAFLASDAGELDHRRDAGDRRRPAAADRASRSGACGMTAIGGGRARTGGRGAVDRSAWTWAASAAALHARRQRQVQSDLPRHGRRRRAMDPPPRAGRPAAGRRPTTWRASIASCARSARPPSRRRPCSASPTTRRSVTRRCC